MICLYLLVVCCSYVAWRNWINFPLNNLKVTKLVNENNSSCVFCDQVPLKVADGEETCSVFLQAVQHLTINWETCHLSFSE